MKGVIAAIYLSIVLGMTVLLTVMALAQQSLDDSTEFTFFEIRVTDHGELKNERFFLGRIPKIGEAVELVYVGDTRHGGMRFQLRTKDDSK